MKFGNMMHRGSWGWVGPAANGTLGSLGAATAYPEVGKFQAILLEWKPTVLPRYGKDNKYGGEVHKAIKAYMDFKRIYDPVIASSVEIDRLGPDAVRTFWPPAQIGTRDCDVLQQAWREWKNTPRVVQRPADAPEQAEEATRTDLTRPSEGGSALKVLGLAVGGAFLTWLIWTIATDDGK